MQGAEIGDEGSVLKYMTKSEIEEQRSSLLIMTQRPECLLLLTTLPDTNNFKRNNIEVYPLLQTPPPFGHLP